MIQKVSTTYSKEHCTCYDEYEDNVLVAVMIEPESGYKLRYTDNENTYDVSGFALININMIGITNSTLVTILGLAEMFFNSSFNFEAFIA